MKNLRKIVSLLLAMMMLISMLPTASAETYDTIGPVNCNHPSFGGWYWVHGEPSCSERGGWQVRDCNFCGYQEDRWVEHSGKHSWSYHTISSGSCVSPATEQRVCSNCGTSETITGSYGSHSWGGWQTISSGSCISPAAQQRICSVCGKSETNTGDYGSHSWGEWWTAHTSTCTERGLMGRTCAICGDTKYSYSDLVAHSYGEWTVVQEPTVEAPGIESRFCIYGCGAHEDREASGATAIPQLQCVITLSSPPANGTHFVPGETARFDIHWENPTPFTLTNGNITAFACSAQNEGAVLHSSGRLSWPAIPAEMSGEVNYEYTVTEADVERGAFYAAAKFFCAAGETPALECLSNFVTVPCGEATDDGLIVTKQLISTPSRLSGVFEPGDTLSYMITVQNKTGVDLFDVEISDPLKGGNEDSVINRYPVMPAGEGVSNHFYYTVTMDDAAQEGISNTAYAMGNRADGSQVTGTSNTVFAEVYHIGEMGITKSVVNTPLNGEYFVPGEKIEFAITLTNDTNYPFYLPLLLDPLCEDQYIYDSVNNESSLFSDGSFGNGHTETVNVAYTVTKEDAEAGFVENTAVLNYMTFNGVNMQSFASATAKCGMPDVGLSDGLNITKKVTSTPANSEYYVPGETVNFEVFVYNTGDTLYSLGVFDWMWGNNECAFGDIKPDETVTYPIAYTVTELDAASGSVSNIAHAEAFDAAGKPVVEYSNVVTVPCGFAASQKIVLYEDMLRVTKETESLPLNGQYYTAGEAIAYKITYENIGKDTLLDVTVYDALCGMQDIATAEKLEPGESRICRFDYTVTEADAIRGSISNTAVGQYDAYGTTHTVNSNTVTEKTSATFYTFTYATWLPEGDEDLYDPAAGWITDWTADWAAGEITDLSAGGIAAGISTPFGIVDTKELRTGEDYCERILTARDSASVTYDTAFCQKHAYPQSSLLMMQQAAVTPETKMQAAAYAVALWRTEVEAIYREIADSADSAAKATVMTEYIRFATDVANYEAVLKALHPDEPALVAEKVAAMWEEKCVTLCNEAHAGAAQRKDSLLSVTAAAGTFAEQCGCEIVAAQNSQKSDVRRYCPVHGFPFSMIDGLLQGKETYEGFAMLRQIFSIELTRAYNELSAKLGEQSDLAMVEYNTLTQWMMAREASLIALYPNNPELVAQTMVKLIMDRVNDLCSITK